MVAPLSMHARTLAAGLCLAVLASACGGGGPTGTPPDPPALAPMPGQVLLVGASARFESQARSFFPDAALTYTWTVRRLQSDHPYAVPVVYETLRAGGPVLDFPVARPASWDVSLTVSDPVGGSTTVTARLVGRHTFVDNRDGTATNLQTGLMWQLADDGNYHTLAEARGRAVRYPGDDNGQDVCGSFVRAGHDDWRVPTLPEMQTLLDFTRGVFPIVGTFVSTTRSASYYVSDSPTPDGNVDWINTIDGQISNLDSRERGYLRCVRP